MTKLKRINNLPQKRKGLWHDAKEILVIQILLDVFWCQAMLGLIIHPAGDHIIELILSINIDNNRED